MARIDGWLIASFRAKPQLLDTGVPSYLNSGMVLPCCLSSEADLD